MKKKLLFIILTLFVIPYTSVFAAGSASISANSQVTNGNSITATISLRNVAAWDLKANGSGSTNGCSIHEVGDSGNGNNTNKSFTITCKANSIGKIVFSFSGDVTSSDGVNTPISGSKTVEVVKPREKSNINYLNNLKVEGHDLSPEFNKDTYNYTVELDSDVENINITCSKGDGYQSVSGLGKHDVELGENKFEIVVEPEVGDNKTYTIIATVKDANPINVSLDSNDYTVVKKNKNMECPESFEEATIKINDIDIPAFKNEKTGITLVGLKDKNGDIKLVKYDNGNYSKYEVLESKSIKLVFKDVKDTKYKTDKVKINDTEYVVYKNGDDLLVYGTNLETGKDGWYKLDKDDLTIQKYDNSKVEKKLEKADKDVNNYKVMVLAAGIFSAFLLVLVLILVVILCKKNKLIRAIKDSISKKDVRPSEKKADKVEVKSERKVTEKVTPKKTKTLAEIEKEIDDEMSTEFVDKPKNKRRKVK